MAEENQIQLGAGFSWGAGLVAISVILGLAFVWRLPPEIPLFYSRPLGRSQLTSGWWLVVLPSLNLLFFSMNWFLAQTIKSISEVMAAVLSWMSTLVALLITVAMIHVLLLIF